MQVPYGKLQDGTPISQTVLTNDNGMEVRFISYGAAITDIVVPDRDGRMANVNLGFGDIADWEARNKDYAFGAIMGRYAGRIAGAAFTIDGKEYALARNEGKNTLHGGPGGFDCQVWKVERWDGSGAALSLSSPAGSQGFPGRLDVRVTYSLTEDNALQIDFYARTDAPTVCNFTNHAYFNLAGAGSGSVLSHRLQVFADRYVVVDDDGIPSGEFRSVTGTPFDFRAPAEIGPKMKHPLVGERGYNHSWWIPDQRGAVARLAARLTDPGSGRVLDVLTTQPSLHVYAAGYFSGEDKGAQGTPYRRYDGIALEAQHLSNAPNNRRLPSTLLRPGAMHRSTTIYRFGLD